LPKFPRLSGADIVRALEKLGFVVARQSGSHIVMKRDGQGCVAPNHEEVKIGTVNGVPDAQWGEAVNAIIELKLGAKRVEEYAMTFCRERLGGMKKPKSIEIWDSVPRSSVGKVHKREIRERFWVGQQRRV